ncbi:ras family small GTPase, partial [Reticulomyxa filosa]
MAVRPASQSHSQSQSQSQPRDSEPDFYVGVFGSSAVGKTSIVSQFVHGVFQQAHDPTIEGERNSYRKIFAFDDKRLLLDILDTAGQEEFASLQDSWIRTRDAFLFVIAYGDVHFNKSWTCLEHYVSKLIKSTNGNIAALPIVVAATRIDEYPPEQYEAQKKIVTQFIKNNNFGYVEISASNKEKVKECFMQLVTRQNEMTLAIASTDVKMNNNSGQTSKWLQTINLCGSTVKTCKQRLVGESLEMEQQIELQQRLRLNQVQEKDVPVDKVLLPVLSLKEFNIVRKFRWDILVRSLIYGLVLPLRLLWQLIAFCSFSPSMFRFYFFLSSLFPYEQLWIKYPRDLDYTRPEAISYDLLGLVVGRKELVVSESTNDKEKQKASVKNYIWFLNQSREQLIERFFLFLIASGVFALIIYHLYYASKFVYYDDNVSVVETAGPFCLYIVFWVLFSVWISYDVVIDPPLASWHKLLAIELYFGEHFEYKVTAGEYLYAYERAKLRPKQFPSYFL